MSGNLAEDITSLDSNELSPLVVDLDGTLLRSDVLVESFLALVTLSPMAALRSLAKTARGKAAFKNEIAQQAYVDFEALPFNQNVVEWLQLEKSKGRDIYIASASNEKYVQAIADHLGFFTGIFASTAALNLKGKAKADLLCATFGRGGFDYVGNDSADLKVWEHADHVIAVNVTPKLQRTIKRQFPDARFFLSPPLKWRDYAAILRPHQWAKNLLIFVPAFMAHDFNLKSAALSFLGFVSFSLCASGAYILNDLLDLRHDRKHDLKRHRPFASGKVSLALAPLLIALLTLGSITAAIFLPWKFFMTLSVYYVLTVGYSVFLKQQMIADVVTLALLYCVRIVAGAAAVTVLLSPWLLSFSVFVFLCLALIKRCSEIVGRKEQGRGDPSGRGYRLADLPMLESMASSSGYVAALTSGLYISSSTVTQLYSHPERLWAIPIILLFWLSRILMLTHRGNMHEDPVFFAIRDRTSLVCATCMLVTVLASI